MANASAWSSPRPDSRPSVSRASSPATVAQIAFGAAYGLRAHRVRGRAGKLGVLLDAVSRPEGATLEDLAAASGWLPHTTRAAIARLRQRGFDVRLATMWDAQGLSPGPSGLIDAELGRDRRRRGCGCRAIGSADRRPARPADRRPAAGLVRSLGHAAAEGGAAAAADARHRLEVAGRAARRLRAIGRAAARGARGGLPATERCPAGERAPIRRRAAPARQPADPGLAGGAA